MVSTLRFRQELPCDLLVRRYVFDRRLCTEGTCQHQYTFNEELGLLLANLLMDVLGQILLEQSLSGTRHGFRSVS